MTSSDTPLLTSPDTMTYVPAWHDELGQDDDVLQLHDPTAVIPQHLASMASDNMRPQTIAQRRRSLRRLCAALSPDVTLLEAETDQIREHINRKGLGVQGRNDEISHLRSFYRWAILEGLTETDPTLRIRRPKLPRRLPRPMPDDDVDLAFHHAPLPRVRPALWFATYAGLRAHDMSSLRAEDLHWSEGYIFIPEQKGGSQGTVPMSDQLAEGLRTCQLPASGWLFPYLDGKDGPIPGRIISKVVNNYLHDIGIDDTLHTLRHWYGTQVFRASGRDLRQTQELMRHQSVNSTMGYTFVDPGEAAGIVNRLRRVNGS